MLRAIRRSLTVATRPHYVAERNPEVFEVSQPDPILYIVPKRASEHSEEQAADQADGNDAAALDRGPIDVSTFPVLLGRYWEPLAKYAERLLDDADAADDVVQQAFARLWERRESWTQTGSLRSYLYRLVRNLVIDEARSRKRRLMLLTAHRGEAPQHAATPGQVLESKELAAAVERAIQALPERRREVFVLAHLQNLSYAEVAEIMGISPNTISNHMTLALQDLRAALAAFLPH